MSDRRSSLDAAAAASLLSSHDTIMSATSTVASPSHRQHRHADRDTGETECLECTPLTDAQLAIWNTYLQRKDQPPTVTGVQESVVHHVNTTLARTARNVDTLAAYQATAHSVRDQLIHRWDKTQIHHTDVDQKRVYYLSLEFLLGRSLDNAVLNLEVKGVYKGMLACMLGMRLLSLFMLRHFMSMATLADNYL